MAAAPEVCIYFYNWEGPIGFQAIQRNVWSIQIIALSKRDRFAPSSHRRLRFENSC